MDKGAGVKGRSFYLATGVVLWLIIFFSGLANASTVGVVFDDSGSMSNRFYTPLFALQLLIASLETTDRMFIVRMSDPGKPVYIPNDISGRQRFINRMKNWSARAKTPVSSVYTALSELSSKNSEEGNKLIILTDGGFNSELFKSVGVSSRIKRYYEQFKGRTLDVYFIAIVPDAKSVEILSAIESQGVRSDLLRQFNGSEDAGRIDMRSAATFLTQMKDLIARVNGSDPGNSNTIQYQDKCIEFTPPFAVHALSVLLKGDVRTAFPKVVDVSFSERRKRWLITGDMREGDAISSVALNGGVAHFEPWPQLSGGVSQEICFDRKVTEDNARLMFRTSVTVDWELYDDAGNQLQPDKNGVIKVSQGETFKVRAYLYEQREQGKEKIDLSGLPSSPSFSLQSSLATIGAATGSKEMKLDPALNAAISDIRFDQAGANKLAVRVRYPGFLDVRPKDLRVEVTEVVQIKMRIDVRGGADCPACQADDVKLIYTEKDRYKEVLEMELVALNDYTGDAEVSLQWDKPLPDGVYLTSSDGKRWRGGLLSKKLNLSLKSGEVVALKLVYNKDYSESDVVKRKLTINAEEPRQGSVDIMISLMPENGKVDIVARGHTLDPSGTQPFRLKVTDLAAGEGMYFSFEGLEDEVNLEHVSLQAKNARAPLALQLDKGSMVRVIPEAWLACDCFTATGEQGFALEYFNPKTRQRAVYNGVFELAPVGLWERCWQEFIIAVLFFLFLIKLVCLFRTSRFPRRARLIETNRGDIIRRTKLHSWFALFWPLCGSEKRRGRGLGLWLSAEEYGVKLLPTKRGYPDGLFYNGESLQEQYECNGNLPLFLQWGANIEDRRDRGLQVEYLITDR